MDDGAETSVETAGAFSLTVDSVAGGPRKLSVRAVDVNGLAGPWLTVPFTYAGAAPKLSLLKAADAQGERDFKPGVQVSTIEGKASVPGTVEAANPLTELSCTINGGAPMKLAFSKTPVGAAFAVPLPPSLPYGVLDLVVSAVDAYGRKGSARAPVLAVDYSRPREGPLLGFGLPIPRPGGHQRHRRTGPARNQGLGRGGQRLDSEVGVHRRFQAPCSQAPNTSGRRCCLGSHPLRGRDG
jgi:hypothetical protein